MLTKTKSKPKAKPKTKLIVRDKDILGGIPCFAGTRVPVKNLFDCLQDGQSLEEFLDDFPSVTRRQAEELLEKATDLVVVS